MGATISRLIPRNANQRSPGVAEPFRVGPFEEQSRGVKGNAQSLGQTKDVEDEAVTRQQLGVVVWYLEEDLDQELNPGASQVIDDHLVLSLPHVGMVPDLLQDPFTELD